MRSSVEADMRRLLLVSFSMLVGCLSGRSASLPSPSAPAEMPGPQVHGVLPAGLCQVDTYLSEECGETLPKFAAIEGPFDDVAAAQRALASARTLGLATGYPFAATLSELRLKDHPVRGIVIVHGLYAFEVDVPRTKRTHTAVVEKSLAADATHHAVQVTDDTPAWSMEDVESAEDAAQLDRRPPGEEKRKRALASTKPLCAIARGALFVAHRSSLHRFGHLWAPVTCAGGWPAWVRWTATRLDSVEHDTSDGPVRDQVVEVECDVASIERRSLKTRATLSVAFNVCPG